MPPRLLSLRRRHRPFLLGLAVVYCLFALTPSLFLHAHHNEDPALAQVVHAHVHLAGHAEKPHGHEHGDELSHLVEHAAEHAQETTGDHYGLDAPSPMLASSNSSGATVFFNAVVTRSPALIMTPPPGLEHSSFEPAPRAHCHFQDGFPPFLTSALPPPAHA